MWPQDILAKYHQVRMSSFYGFHEENLTIVSFVLMTMETEKADCSERRGESSHEHLALFPQKDDSEQPETQYDEFGFRVDNEGNVFIKKMFSPSLSSCTFPSFPSYV